MIDFEDKNVQLYIKQKETLDTFLSKKAISEAQYNKSLGDLTKLMKMEEVLEHINKQKLKKICK